MLKDYIAESADNSNKSVIIYGATIGGMTIMQLIEKINVKIIGFCDQYFNDDKYCGLPVLRINDLEKYPETPVIIAVTRAMESVCSSLKENNVNSPVYSAVELVTNGNIKELYFANNEEKIKAEMFLEQYPKYVHFFESSSNVFPSFQVFITEVCTLKCFFCSHMIPHYSVPKNYNIDDIIKQLELLEKCSVKIIELIIIGGEPLLHPKLDKLLEWVCKKRNLFNIVTIITNGTVIPKEYSKTLIKQGKISLRISNYGKYSDKILILKEWCEQENVPYFTPNEKWSNLGSGEPNGLSDDRIKQMYLECPFIHDNLLLNGRLYHCAHGAHLHNLGKIPDCEDDYIEINGSVEKLKDKIKNYILSDKFSACRYCKGIDYSNPIEPGEVQTNHKK